MYPAAISIKHLMNEMHKLQKNKSIVNSIIFCLEKHGKHERNGLPGAGLRPVGFGTQRMIGLKWRFVCVSGLTCGRSVTFERSDAMVPHRRSIRNCFPPRISEGSRVEGYDVMLLHTPTVDYRSTNNGGQG